MNQIDEKMIEIKGQKVSESTIVEALRKHCGFQEKYQFRAGDVVKNRGVGWRIIIKENEQLKSFHERGHHLSTNQNEFEEWGYRKITTLSKLIKCWEKHNG